MWIFSQSKGTIADNEAFVLTRDAYAGRGVGLNNPAMQNVEKIGPLPRGFYTIGKAYYHEHLGPVTMNLEPDPENEMFGRSEFRIHGRKTITDRDASEGCIVADHDYRVAIDAGNDRRLQVVE